MNSFSTGLKDTVGSSGHSKSAASLFEIIIFSITGISETFNHPLSSSSFSEVSLFVNLKSSFLLEGAVISGLSSGRKQVA